MTRILKEQNKKVRKLCVQIERSVEVHNVLSVLSHNT